MHRVRRAQTVPPVSPVSPAQCLTESRAIVANVPRVSGPGGVGQLLLLQGFRIRVLYSLTAPLCSSLFLCLSDLRISETGGTGETSADSTGIFRVPPAALGGTG